MRERRLHAAVDLDRCQRLVRSLALSTKSRAIDKTCPICDFPGLEETARISRPAMMHDVDMMRDLLFLLAERQISPRSNVVLSIDAEAGALGQSSETVEAGLNMLLDLDYIDGPGQDEPGFWLFRKLTRKGNDFIKATRREDDWQRLKRHFARQQPSHGPG